MKQVNDFGHWFDELVHEVALLQTQVHQAEMEERRKREEECLDSDPGFQNWLDGLNREEQRK